MRYKPGKCDQTTFVGVRKKAELVKTFDKLGVMYKNSSKWEERSEDARGFIL